MKININEKDRILIVAPHPDDETIGCGGILAKYGSQCDVLLITDGRLGFFENCSVTDTDDMAHSTFVLYNSFSGKKGDVASTVLDLDITSLVEAEYKLNFVFFQKEDSIGYNVDVDMVNGLCLEKHFTNNHGMLWNNKKWGHIVMPAPKVAECIDLID